MKITVKGIVWIVVVMVVISQVGCGARSRATKDGGAVTREVYRW